MSTLKCPYCWKQLREKELTRRCPEECGAEQGYFPAGAKLCPHKRVSSTARYCPHCEKYLEHDYITTPGKVIAMIGSSDSGKSTYVGVLINELQNRIGEVFDGMATELVGDSSRDRYHRLFAKPLFEDGRTVSKTDTFRAARRLEPLLFMMRRPRTSKLPFRGQLVTGMNVFYDTAGEDILREQSMGPLATYLDAADAIIFVLDPLQVSSVRRSVGDSTPVPPNAPNQVAMLQRLGELLRERRRLPPTRRIETPIAIVVAKTDALGELIPSPSALMQPGPHDGVYDEADGRHVHDEVRAVLSGWTQGHELLNTVENSFSTYRFFGMSALGAPPTGPTDISRAGIHPVRVEDPLLWLMGRFGLIQVRKAKR